MTYEQYCNFLKRWEGKLSNDRDDKGGLTNGGVTLPTLRRVVPGATESDLQEMTRATWRQIVRLHWDRWHADELPDQPRAMLVDWLWMSGTWGVKFAQAVMGVEPDGIIGPQTLAAAKEKDPDMLTQRLYEARIRHFNRICQKDATQLKFINGWRKRATELMFGDSQE